MGKRITNAHTQRTTNAQISCMGPILLPQKPQWSCHLLSYWEFLKTNERFIRNIQHYVLQVLAKVPFSSMQLAYQANAVDIYVK
jgi:hypothetical protein